MSTRHTLIAVIGCAAFAAGCGDDDSGSDRSSGSADRPKVVSVEERHAQLQKDPYDVRCADIRDKLTAARITRVVQVALADDAKIRGLNRLQASQSIYYILVLAAQVECVRGDVRLAAAHADEGYALTEQAGQATLGAYLLALRALAHSITGEEREARECAARALAVADQTSGRPAEHFARAALGALELSLGRAAETAEVLGPLVEFLRRERICEPGTARVVPDQIEALIALGHLDRASEVLDWYAENGGRLDRPSALAAAARCRGLLLAQAGELEGPWRSSKTGCVSVNACRYRSSMAVCCLRAARFHRRARHKRAARESLESALAVFDRIGARIWAERARAEMARVGGRAPASGGLTPTEIRVAELVAEGLQTKQVAAALFVSPKTVEGHLTNIYAKLGVHSRGELARRLTPSA